MKKIRLADQTEIEIYNISASGNTLMIAILNGDATALEAVFQNKDDISVIQHYAGVDLIRGYAGYTQLKGYHKSMGQTISTDWSAQDASTESGFAETKADILTIYLEKPDQIATVAGQTEQNAADIAYMAMETGVEL